MAENLFDAEEITAEERHAQVEAQLFAQWTNATNARLSGLWMGGKYQISIASKTVRFLCLVISDW